MAGGFLSLAGQGHGLELQAPVILSRLDNLLCEVEATLVLIPLPHLGLQAIVTHALEKVARGIVGLDGWPICQADEAKHGVGIVRSIARGKRCHVLNLNITD